MPSCLGRRLWSQIICIRTAGGGARVDHLLYQAKLALDDTARLKVVRKMYKMRFKEEPPARRSVEQLRGIEGVRVRKVFPTDLGMNRPGFV